MNLKIICLFTLIMAQAHASENSVISDSEIEKRLNEFLENAQPKKVKMDIFFWNMFDVQKKKKDPIK